MRGAPELCNGPSQHLNGTCREASQLLCKHADISLVVDGQLYMPSMRRLPFGGRDVTWHLQQRLAVRGIAIDDLAVVEGLKEACATAGESGDKPEVSLRPTSVRRCPVSVWCACYFTSSKTPASLHCMGALSRNHAAATGSASLTGLESRHFGLLGLQQLPHVPCTRRSRQRRSSCRTGGWCRSAPRRPRNSQPACCRRRSQASIAHRCRRRPPRPSSRTWTPLCAR